MKQFFVLLSILLLYACGPYQTTSTLNTTIITHTLSLTKIKPENVQRTNTPTQFSSTLTPTSTPIPYCVHSPLAGEDLNGLKEILSNPFDPPPFGQDSGHHGVDFAYFTHGDQTSIQGLPIYNLLSGYVAANLADTIPYGNLVIIETPLNKIPSKMLSSLALSMDPVPDDPNYRLNCPTQVFDFNPSLDKLSIYHLYAHLEEPANFPLSEYIECGSTIGKVGNTGMSSNPHLHLETRLGPASITFNKMDHYTASASIEEMTNYCLWRMSGYFQLFDPFILLEKINVTKP